MPAAQRWVLAALLAAAIPVVAPSRVMADLRLDGVQGHLALGYGRLLIADSPAGSFAVGAGLDYPISGSLRAGADVGFVLLGSLLVERGSLSAEVNSNLFEALALVHWTPPRGPWLLSIGPGFFSARSDLSSSGVAAFRDLAVEETAPGAAIGLALLPRRSAPVKAGFEIGTHVVWMPHGTWTVGMVRLITQY